jgi:predicted Rossmann fold nucleotide-binding protein DprA/Smf involved in DNA uptake
VRTIIAGSRSIRDIMLVYSAMDLAETAGIIPTVVLSGTAAGVDEDGERWAMRRGIPVERYPADWDTYGRSAGFRRNELMVSKAEAVVVLWDGESKGAAHTVRMARRAMLKLLVVEIGQ